MVNIKMVGQQFVVLSCLLLGLSVSANDANSAVEELDFQSILQEALNKIHDDYVDHFAFREEVTRKGLNVVGDYDPSRVNVPWILLSSDGKEPSDKEMKQYAKDKLKQTELLTDQLNVLRDASEYVGKYFSIEYNY